MNPPVRSIAQEWVGRERLSDEELRGAGLRGSRRYGGKVFQAGLELRARGISIIGTEGGWLDMTVEELIAQIRGLPAQDLHRLLDVIEGQVEVTASSRASDWAPLFGTIEAGQAEEILEAIRDDCRQVDQSGW